MGDMADYDIEQGLDMWLAHQVGDCFQDCIYCDEGYEKVMTDRILKDCNARPDNTR